MALDEVIFDPPRNFNQVVKIEFIVIKEIYVYHTCTKRLCGFKVF